MLPPGSVAIELAAPATATIVHTSASCGTRYCPSGIERDGANRASLGGDQLPLLHSQVPHSPEVSEHLVCGDLATTAQRARLAAALLDHFGFHADAVVRLDAVICAHSRKGQIHPVRQVHPQAPAGKRDRLGCALTLGHVR